MNEHIEYISGIPSVVAVESFPGGQHMTYRFTVPGWRECCVAGKKAAQRVIRGRTDSAVINTLRIDPDLNPGGRWTGDTSVDYYVRTDGDESVGSHADYHG